MKRWSFVSGLTVILLLVLVLSGFSVAVIRSLTDDLDRLIATNYDTIRAVRDIRDSTTRIDAHYRKAITTTELPEERGVFDHERAGLEQSLAFVVAQAREPAAERRAARLSALLLDYLDAYENYLGLSGNRSRIAEDRFANATTNLAQLTGDISAAGADIIEDQERQIFERRDGAVARGRQATTLALAIVAVSLLVYIVTSMRLARGVYQPLRDLRDAIARVRERRFEVPIRVDGSEELGQIATAFNAMANELRVYVAETDEKAVQAARDCRAILAALPYPVYIVGEKLEVRLSNPRADQLSASAGVPGALPASVRRQIDLAAERGHDLVDNDMRRVIDGGEPAADGRGPVSYMPQVFRLVDTHGCREGWAVLLVDVTTLRRLDEAKTKALSTLGHEVKTPVTGIRMSLHLLLEQKLGALNEDQRELIAAGRDDCERLLSVLQSLLELARLESGRAVFKLQPVPVENLLAQADAMHGEFVRKNGMTLVAPEGPGVSSSVTADLAHAARVLGNFLSNAAKYGMPGGEVRLTANERADGFVRFSVSNPAERPLSDEEQARIFDPFYRRPGEQAEGSGLGLTIAREIATAHGGRIGVWCEDGRIEFYLDLPRVGPVADAAG